MSLTAIAGGAPGNLDPRRSLDRLALRLEEAHEADPGNALLARELRATLLALGAGAAGRRVDEVDRIRAEWEGLHGTGV